MTRRLVCVALLLAASAAALATPRPPARERPPLSQVGTASVTGVVVARDQTRAPLRSALVTLSRLGADDIRTLATDDAGRYSFLDLPAGTYLLGGSKGGYLASNYGALQDGMPGSAIPLADGQRFAAAPIALIRGGVITGRVSDRFGRPVANALMFAAQLALVNGEQRPRLGANRTARTNAHGDYRFFGLPAGEYFLYAELPRDQMLLREITSDALAWAERPTGAPPTADRQVSYAPTVYPGTPDPGAAAPIAVAIGEERTGIDLVMQSVPVARVRGIVTAPDGQAASRVSVTRELNRRDTLFPAIGAAVTTDSAGVFTFHGVPPGEFVLTARSSVGPALWGRTEISVTGEDLENHAIRLQPALSLRGRVVVKDRSQPAPRPRVTVSLAPGGRGTFADILPTSDGTFRIEGVIPGAFRFVTTVESPTWAVHSIAYAGRDLADVPLDVREGDEISDIVITLTDRMAGVTGTLTDSTGRPAPELYVFMFPVDRSFWTRDSRRIRAVRADLGGAYSVTGLPAGEYYLCATTAIDATLQSDAAYLELFVPAAIRMTLGDAEQRTQDLRVGR